MNDEHKTEAERVADVFEADEFALRHFIANGGRHYVSCSNPAWRPLRSDPGQKTFVVTLYDFMSELHRRLTR